MSFGGGGVQRGPVPPYVHDGQDGSSQICRHPYKPLSYLVQVHLFMQIYTAKDWVMRSQSSVIVSSTAAIGQFTAPVFWSQLQQASHNSRSVAFAGVNFLHCHGWQSRSPVYFGVAARLGRTFLLREKTIAAKPLYGNRPRTLTFRTF